VTTSAGAESPAPRRGAGHAHPAYVPEPEPGFFASAGSSLANVVEQFGQFGRMTAAALVAMWRRPLELRSTIYQMEQIGVASLGIACVTAVFVGMVMAVQFSFGLQRFGGMEYVGRVVGISFARELAPTLTAVIVGGRIGSGIAAEVGSMAVTEQIDAIRALGADPIKKLVVPRLVASTITMPVLGAFALVLGFSGAMFVTSMEFGVPAGFFLRSALGSVNYWDYWSGMYKCPVYGAIIALVACHFGMNARGGTEGVGHATTRTVVVTSIAILVSDFFLTKLSVGLIPGKAS
jgi:phospholipid/cholesterol/gamma-HCH transport system permease protein